MRRYPPKKSAVTKQLAAMDGWFGEPATAAKPDGDNLGEFWASVDPRTGALRLVGGDPAIFTTVETCRNDGIEHVRVRITRVRERR